MEPVSGNLSIRGLRVHYQLMQPDGRPAHRVLLLNAPMTTMFNWRLLLPEMQALNCLVAMIDLPGYGQSSCGGRVPQSAATRAQLVWDALNEIEMEIESNFQLWHLISHGSACLTALCMAYAEPAAIASQVMISPVVESPMPPFYRRFPGNRMLERRFQRWYAEQIASRPGMSDMFQRWFGRFVPDYVLDRMRRPLLRPGMKAQLWRLIGEGFQVDPAVFQAFIPTMAVWGRHDPMFGSAEAAHFRELMPDAEVHELHTAAHFPQETHSKATCDFLRGWLRYIDENAMR